MASHSANMCAKRLGSVGKERKSRVLAVSPWSPQDSKHAANARLPNLWPSEPRPAHIPRPCCSRPSPSLRSLYSQAKPLRLMPVLRRTRRPPHRDSKYRDGPWALESAFQQQRQLQAFGSSPLDRRVEVVSQLLDIYLMGTCVLPRTLSDVVPKMPKGYIEESRGSAGVAPKSNP